jgi:hypothetical protein
MKRTIAMVGLVGVLATAAHAGSISITATQDATYDGTTVTSSLTVTNQGDEAALAVVPKLRFGDQEVRGTLHEELAPGATVSDTLAVEVGELGPGRWPFSLAIDYADGNQYPFQALQMAAITVGSPSPATVTIPKVEADPLATTSDLRITVKNLSAEPRQASLAMHLPHGLEATKGAQESVSLEPWGEREVVVAITNRTALPGSRYPVFATLEYDEGDTHHALVAQGMVEIISAENAVAVHGNRFWMGAAVLGGIFVLLLAWRGLRG